MTDTEAHPCDVLIIGAGAAGMMCAIEAGKRGRRVVLIDHAKAPGEKIRISGGGRCNFTNSHTRPENFISANRHFCKSALSRYTQHDFIKMMAAHDISWHEKTLGQLFCDHSAKDIIHMLLDEMESAGVDLALETAVTNIEKRDGMFYAETSRGPLTAAAVVIATGGLSIPKMGATSFGYDIARQFDHKIIPTAAALVPLLFDPAILKITKPLSGLSVDGSRVTCRKTSFQEDMLLTHKGLSGPSILQISSYWEEGLEINIDLLPAIDLLAKLKELRQSGSQIQLRNALAQYLPQRLAEMICLNTALDGPVADQSDKKLTAIADHVHRWRIKPIGTEGYRTAEVTRGGVDTNDLSSKTMESRKTPGLYFIGEVVDVTGWLGGYNFQWAWSSGWCAGQYT